MLMLMWQSSKFRVITKYPTVIVKTALTIRNNDVEFLPEGVALRLMGGRGVISFEASFKT